MTPGHPLGVVGWAVRRTAGRTGKAAAWSEVDLDIEPACLGVEYAATDSPRRGQAQRQLQQGCDTHGWSFAFGPILFELGAVLAAVKDAARRASARCPAAIPRLKPEGRLLTATVRGALWLSGRDGETAPDLKAQPVERAQRAADGAGRHLRVARCRIEAAVAEQRLDDADVSAALQQMGGEAMRQCMHGDALAETRRGACRAAGGMQHGCVDRMDHARETVSTWAALFAKTNAGWRAAAATA